MQTTGSYTKVKAHLLKISDHGIRACNGQSEAVHEQIKREHLAAERRRDRETQEKKMRAKYVSLPSGSDLVQPKKKKGTIEEALNVIERDEADKDIARMFFAAALPFNLIRNPYFRQVVQRLANGRLAVYVPPPYNRLRTTLLEQEATHIKTFLQPFRDSWKKNGVSLCSDGWGDRQKRPLINMMAASGGSAMFLKAIDTSGNTKDADYIASLFLEVIENEGPENFVQIITDSASNFKAAATQIEGRYSHIFWTPCVVHALNLAIKSICEPSENASHYDACKWISPVLSACVDIRQFVVNHLKALTIYNKYTKLTLLSVGETRFASYIIMAKRLLKVKIALERMVLDPDWKAFRRTHLESKAEKVKECVLSDSWWDKIDYFLKFTEPMNSMLRFADMDTPCLHLVYDLWDSMIEEIHTIIFQHEGQDVITGHSPFFDSVQHVLEARWTKSNTPLHCLAHALVPKYYAPSWLEGGNVFTPRVAPNEDSEIAQNRDKCFKRLYLHPNDLRQIFDEYGSFISSKGYFKENHVMEERVHEDPLILWANYGSSTPLLQSLALKLLSQPASSSCCERNWSVYSLIQTIKRNKLSSKTLEQLVFIHNNLRILSRKKEEYLKGPTSYWDIGGDTLLLDEEDLFEFANLMLDDPEAVFSFFEDNDADEAAASDAVEYEPAA